MSVLHMALVTFCGAVVEWKADCGFVFVVSGGGVVVGGGLECCGVVWWRGWGRWVVLVALKYPWWVAVHRQNLLGPAEFTGLAFRTRGEEMGASGEGVDCGAFVVEGLITIPWDVWIGFL
jgi:hypothetical protein